MRDAAVYSLYKISPGREKNPQKKKEINGV
jgi:hypothetical protein